MTLSDWFVISQLKENIMPTVFYSFMDKIIQNQKYKEGLDEDDDLEKCNGLNKGRKDALIFCAEKFKATIPHISVVRKPDKTKGGETVSQSTCESSLIDQA